jgi:acyl carrier protein
VEKLIVRYGNITAAAVVARDDGAESKELAAFYISARDESAAGLRAHLAPSLPGYMIPSIFIRTGHLPLTSSGKVDRRALEAVATTAERPQKPGGAHRNEQEKRVLEIWTKTLGVKEAGVFDNFFDLGGHSIKAAQLASRIRKEFGIEISPGFIFENPTVEKICQAMESQKPGAPSARGLDKIGRASRVAVDR